MILLTYPLITTQYATVDNNTSFHINTFHIIPIILYATLLTPLLPFTLYPQSGGTSKITGLEMQSGFASPDVTLPEGIQVTHRLTY